MYREDMVQPMRDELTQIGAVEMRTPEEVDTLLGQSKDGTTLVVVNSVCGCAAGGARPGVALALKNDKRPTKVLTVFAGQDKEATAQARTYFTGQPVSSPAMVLFKDGQLVHMLHRSDIEGRTPELIAAQLTRAFETYCA